MPKGHYVRKKSVKRAPLLARTYDDVAPVIVRHQRDPKDERIANLEREVAHLRDVIHRLMLP